MFKRNSRIRRALFAAGLLIPSSVLLGGLGPQAGASFLAPTIAGVGNDAAPALSQSALAAESCPTSTFCAVGDDAGNIWTYNGSTWSSTNVDGQDTIADISCPTTSFCAAVDGSAGDLMTWNGTTWTVDSGGDGSNLLDAVSCTSSSFCVAVDDVGNYLTWTGSAWSSVTNFDSAAVMDVSCTSTSFCMAVDENAFAMTFNGTSWSSAVSINGFTTTQAVSCVSSTFCVAISPYQAEASIWTGSSWPLGTVIDNGNTLDDVFCSSTSNCVVVDSSGNDVTYGGTSWGSVTQIDSTNPVTGIDCLSSTSCFGIDAVDNALTDSSGTWSETNLAAKPSVTGMSCINNAPSAGDDFCGAIRNNDSFSYAEYAGTPVWSTSGTHRATINIGVGEPGGLSCTSNSSADDPVCVVVSGSGGGSQLWDYGSPSSAASLSGPSSSVGVSCANPGSGDFCMALTSGGDTYTLSWSGTSLPSSWTNKNTASTLGLTGASWTAISCPSSTFCSIVANNGDISTFNGTSWTTPATVTVSGHTTSNLRGISCYSASDCGAIEASSVWSTTGGWSNNNSRLAVSSAAFHSISCAPGTSTFCSITNSTKKVESGTSLTSMSPYTVPNGVDGNKLASISCYTGGSSGQCVAGDVKANAVESDNGWSTSGESPLP